MNKANYSDLARLPGDDILQEKTVSNCLRVTSVSRFDAQMILQKVTGFSRVELVTKSDYQLTVAEYQAFQNMCQQRSTGQPLAYLLGYREFYGRCFKVTPDVLIPRADTETLIDAVVSRFDTDKEKKHNISRNILDLGTGSGVIGLTLLLEFNNFELWATDLSLNAIKVAQENARILGVEQRAHFIQSISEDDWFDCLRSATRLESFDLICANPPYIHRDDPHLLGDIRFEPRMALTDNKDGLSAYRIIVGEAPDFLRSGGMLIVEHGYDQKDAVQSMFAQAQLSQIQTICDLAGHPRVTLGYKLF